MRQHAADLTEVGFFGCFNYASVSNKDILCLVKSVDA